MNNFYDIWRDSLARKRVERDRAWDRWCKDSLERQLAREAEHGLDPQPNRDDYTLALVGVVGCVAIVALAAVGVV